MVLGSVIWLLYCGQILRALWEMFNLFFDCLYILKKTRPFFFFYKPAMLNV